MHFVSAKSILSPKNGINLYRGCSHDRIYCNSRSKCYHMKHDLEDIEIKANVIELLENALIPLHDNSKILFFLSRGSLSVV